MLVTIGQFITTHPDIAGLIAGIFVAVLVQGAKYIPWIPTETVWSKRLTAAATALIIALAAKMATSSAIDVSELARLALDAWLMSTAAYTFAKKPTNSDEAS